MSTTLDIVSLDEFQSAYTEELASAVRNYPGEYGYPASDATVVAARMMNAIRAKSFNKDSRAIKATCKRFGIKHTYAAIYAALGI